MKKIYIETLYIGSVQPSSSPTSSLHPRYAGVPQAGNGASGLGSLIVPGKVIRQTLQYSDSCQIAFGSKRVVVKYVEHFKYGAPTIKRRTGLVEQFAHTGDVIDRVTVLAVGKELRAVL